MTMRLGGLDYSEAGLNPEIFAASHCASGRNTKIARNPTTTAGTHSETMIAMTSDGDMIASNAMNMQSVRITVMFTSARTVDVIRCLAAELLTLKLSHIL